MTDWVPEVHTVSSRNYHQSSGFFPSSTLMDVLATCDFPIIEVQLSNLHHREECRHFSYVSRIAARVICGCGTPGYTLAWQHLTALLCSLAST